MYIVKGQQNKIALTLTEKAVNADSDWLIKLTNDTTGHEKVFAVDDISQFQERSNIFYITESSNEDLRNGTVSLSPSGQWTYTAYEMAPGSPRNLNPADALKIVEVGRALVFDPSENQIVNFDVDEKKNNAVFE